MRSKNKVLLIIICNCFDFVGLIGSMTEPDESIRFFSYISTINQTLITMKRSTFYAVLVLFVGIIVNACNKKTDTLTPESLIGSWKTVIGENEYITFEVADSEKIYSAYTYNRLAASGTWELEGENLIIKFDYDGSSSVFTAKIVSDTLVLNNGTEKYVKVIEDMSSSIEKPILDEITERFDYGFSIQENVEFIWNLVGENNKVSTKNLEFEVISYPHIFKSTDFSELSESETAIVDYLAGKGFVADTLNISEVNSSFIKGNIIVVFNISANPEPAAGDTAYINVMSSIFE